MGKESKWALFIKDKIFKIPFQKEKAKQQMDQLALNSIKSTHENLIQFCTLAVKNEFISEDHTLYTEIYKPYKRN